MLDQRLIFLDLETTGATATRDRITEIGIVEVDRGTFIGEWCTLVNPEVRIPPAIEMLTGITNEMVADAPTFSEISEELLEKLSGKLLVAHNARFDYGFLRNEFRRIGVPYHSKVLCTVKLSRKLFPQHHRHNLDSLIARHGLACGGRHRALGDARVLWDFAQRIYKDLGVAHIQAAVDSLLRPPVLPAGLPADLADEIPEGPGVYIFYGENKIPLYVGKSANLRSRILSHFSGDHRMNKDMRISQQITRVDWIETAGELGALIREAKLIKELTPIQNRAVRRNNERCSFRYNPSEDSHPKLLSAGDLDSSRLDHVYGLFKAKRDAINTLRTIAGEHGLCLLLLGLEKGEGPCFFYQHGKCRGACVGKESAKNHSMRLLAALGRLRIKSWPFKGRIGVREIDPTGEESEVHILDRWCYLGTVRSESELFDSADLAAEAAFDPETYRILSRFLETGRKRLEIIDLAG